MNNEFTEARIRFKNVELKLDIIKIIKKYISSNEEVNNGHGVCENCGWWDGSIDGHREDSECTCDQNELLETIINEIEELGY